MVYPRVGGATSTPLTSFSDPIGLSPRGRGNQFTPTVPNPVGGSIPAWAGQPGTGCSTDNGKAVYPRVGGATWPTMSKKHSLKGLSPRGRGNQEGVGRNPRLHGSIPAWAGQPATAPSRDTIWRVYPRVGGATRTAAPTAVVTSGLSPRGRGNRFLGVGHILLIRSIPAWAGQPRPGSNTGHYGPVYPRVGGATSVGGIPR